MNRFWGCMLVLLAMTFALGSHAFAMGEKVGYLDVSKVISTSQWGKQISARLKGDQQQLMSNVKNQQDEFTKASSSYEKKQAVMDAKAKARKQAELRQMYMKLQQSMQSAQTQWAQDKKKEMQPLFTKMREVASTVAKKGGYDLIVDRSALIVGDPKDDISAAVIAQLDSTPH